MPWGHFFSSETAFSEKVNEILIFSKYHRALIHNLQVNASRPCMKEAGIEDGWISEAKSVKNGFKKINASTRMAEHERKPVGSPLIDLDKFIKVAASNCTCKMFYILPPKTLV
ncbi:hypothetical protein XENORESO_009646 [Xenotaenia resolanae]|uniref:Uncharacterized protein n=1 Tax=Xenotaenia resolanae TaxID=208358 RepID=A0ABV0VVW6_9TELE